MQRHDAPAGMFGNRLLDEIDARAGRAGRLNLDIERGKAMPVAPPGIALGQCEDSFEPLPQHRLFAVVQQMLARHIGAGHAILRVEHQCGARQPAENLRQVRLTRLRRRPQAASRDGHDPSAGIPRNGA